MKTAYQLLAPPFAVGLMLLCACGGDNGDCLTAEPTATEVATQLPAPTATPTPADPVIQECVRTGGQVSTGECCVSSEDFPDTCSVGACGCAPESSHEVAVCDCGGERCFDGTQCVSIAQDACVRSGGQVSTGECCVSSGDFPDTCSVGACGCAPQDSHEVAVCDCGSGRCFDGTQCTSS